MKGNTLQDALALRRFIAASQAHTANSKASVAYHNYQRINGETGAAHPFQPFF